MRLTNDEKVYYRDLVLQYMHAHPDCTEVELESVVNWALNNDALEMTPAQRLEFHRGRISESLRSEELKDARGRKVRRWHCVRVRSSSVPENSEQEPAQRYLWAPIEDATESFMRTSFLQRREQIQVDVNALAADLDYFNTKQEALGRRPIQLSLNFRPG